MVSLCGKLPENVLDYICLIKNNKHIFESEFSFSEDDIFVKEIGDFLKKTRVLRVKSRVHDIVFRFCDIAEIPYPTVKFPIWSKDFAYMTDAGTLSVSLGFLCRSDSVRIIKVLIHELSHLVLSYRPEYIDLLRLELEYKQTEGLSNLSFISPIELCATEISCDIFEYLGVCTGNSVFADLKNEEITKLNHCIEKLK